jgi:hypothetical protein
MSNDAFIRVGQFSVISHGAREKEQIYPWFTARTFGKRQITTWLKQNPSNPQARGGYRQHKSSGGSCGIPDELINVEWANLLQRERMSTIYPWTPGRALRAHLFRVLRETETNDEQLSKLRRSSRNFWTSETAHRRNPRTILRWDNWWKGDMLVFISCC